MKAKTVEVQQAENPNKKIIAISLVALGVLGIGFTAFKLLGKKDGTEGVESLPEDTQSPPVDTPPVVANVPEVVAPVEVPVPIPAPNNNNSQTTKPTTKPTMQYDLNRSLSISNNKKIEVKILQYFLNTVDSDGQQNKLKVDGVMGANTVKRAAQYLGFNAYSFRLLDFQKENPGRFNMAVEHFGYTQKTLFGFSLFGL